jgi:hypothetical protein
VQKYNPWHPFKIYIQTRYDLSCMSFAISKNKDKHLNSISEIEIPNTDSLILLNDIYKEDII